MPSIKQRRIVYFSFVVIIILSLFPFSIETGKRPNYNINKKLIDEYYNRDNLKNSKHWDLTGNPIHIDGNTGWVIASSQEWCSGSGTFTDPYVIENVTIDGQNSDSCIKIKNSDRHFRIENCTIYNSGIENWDAGIILENVSNGFLRNNNCSFNNRKGIIIKNSHNNTVSKNIVSNNNEIGIALYEYSNNNIISENIANNNSKYGILLIDSNNNIISKNTVNYSMDESGVRLENSKNNIISGNNVNNNQWFGISLFYSENNTILGNTVKNNYYGIHLHFSVNNSILKNTANNNSFGIALYDNDESSVLKNTVHNNENFGIRLQDSDNNKIMGNHVKKNKDDGIILTNCDTNVISENTIEDNQIGLNISDKNSQNNHIYKNYFTGNKKQNAQDDGNNNNWNNTIIGNYWNDHTTLDVDNNGIDDSPYVVSGSSIDFFPIYGDPFHNGKKIHINGNEISGNKSWIWTSTRAWCSGSGTLEDPYIIKDLVVDGENEDICIIIANSSNNYFVIKNCKVYNSGAMWPHAGIRLEYTNNGTLINNNCSSISGNGILLYESNYNLISGNTATMTELVGIYLVNSHNNIISENNASYNFNWNGITLWDSNNNFLLKNTVTKNMIGVYVRNSKYNNISRNSIYKNLDNGLWLYSSTNNIILENNVNDNNYNGIVIDTNSDYNIVSENIVNWNSQAGIGLWNTKYTNISENIVNKKPLIKRGVQYSQLLKLFFRTVRFLFSLWVTFWNDGITFLNFNNLTFFVHLNCFVNDETKN